MSVTDLGLYAQSIGLFDEESCRFFLREIGERVVPFYPFFVGIQEVYCLLLEKYGRAQVADALSLLEELLEDDQNASGIGDDGDIWRSWRHCWRHRDDGKTVISTPRLGDFILPTPTSRRIRLLKAENFIAFSTKESQHDSPSKSSPRACEVCRMSRFREPMLSPLHRPDDRESAQKFEEYLGNPLQEAGSTGQTNPAIEASSSRCLRTLLSKVELSHNGRQVGSSLDITHQRVQHDQDSRSLSGITDISAEEGDKDSQQDFVEVPCPPSTSEFDASLLISFEMLRPRYPLNPPQISLRGGDLDVYTLQQTEKNGPPQLHGTDVGIGETSLFEGVAECPGVEVVGVKEGSAQATNLAEKTSRTPPNDLRTSQVSSPDIDVYLSEDSSDKLAARQALSQSTQPPNPPYFHSQDFEETYFSKDSDFRTSSELRNEKHGSRRAVNRQARLIDGAIFTSRIRKERKEQSSPIKSDEEESAVVGRSAARMSWTGTRQKPLRLSLLQGVRSLFRNQSMSKQKINKQATSTTCTKHVHSTTSMSTPRRSVTSDASNTPEIRNPKTTTLGLDGAFDDDVSPSRSPIDLNKALPARPGEEVRLRSLSSRTDTPSITPLHEKTNVPSTASTLSSAVSRASRKKEFRGLTREATKVDETGQSTDTSSLHEENLLLYPSKYSPLISSQPPQSPISFTSIMNSNTFRDDFPPLTPQMPAPLFIHKARDPMKSYQTRKMPQSRSEPNVQPWPPIDAVTPEYHEYPHHVPIPPMSISPTNAKHDPGHSRGRSLHRPRSPIELLQKVQENEVLEVKRSPRKRSRSPVKRLFGFGKSTSLKDVAGESASTMKETRSDLTKQSGVKSWSNRLRYGFLTTADDAGDRIEQVVVRNTPPSQRSTFPVSLDQIYQARLTGELELMVLISANEFLLHEAHKGRVSPLSVCKLREAWANMNRPEVIEFQYDQLTQRELIMSNLKTVKFYGESAEKPIVLNATMYNWKVMGKEMGVRTYCAPDSVVRKWMHDSHKILEMLGAPLETFLAFQDLQVKTLSRISEAQRRRIERREGRADLNSNSERKGSARTISTEKKDGESPWDIGVPMRTLDFSPVPVSKKKTDMRTKMRKPTSAAGVVEGGSRLLTRAKSLQDRDTEREKGMDVYENSRVGRLGLRIRPV